LADGLNVAAGADSLSDVLYHVGEVPDLD